VGGYSLLLLWSVVQTAAGRAPSDVLWPGTVLAVIGAGLLAAAALALFLGWRHHEPPRIPDAVTETPVPSAL